MFARLFRRLSRASQVDAPHCSYCANVQVPLLEQARRQISAGHYVGAAASAQCEIQWRLRFISDEVETPCGYRKRRYSAQSVLEVLRGRGLVARQTVRRIMAFFNHAGAILNAEASPTAIRARWIVQRAAAICRELDQAICKLRESNESGIDVAAGRESPADLDFAIVEKPDYPATEFRTVDASSQPTCC